MSIYDIKGKVVGKYSPDQTFFDGKVNNALLQQAVLMYLANKRQGCAATKTRADVRGGGRKPWRQKGTGRARVGSIRSPLWKGGGVIFGPHPKEFGYKLAKNVRNAALRHSLNSKLRDEELIVVDNITLTQPKTKEFVAFLKALKVTEKVLVVVDSYNQDVLRASRNIPGVKLEQVDNINAYDVLKYKKIIFSKQALDNLVKLKEIKE